MMSCSKRRLIALSAVLMFGATCAVEQNGMASVAVAQELGTVALKLRQQQGSVDVIISGVGASAKVVNQRQSSASWQASVTSSQFRGRQKTMQQLSLPLAGLQSISLEGSGSTYALRVEARSGVRLNQPQILANGQDLIVRFSGLAESWKGRQTAQLDLRRPGRVAQPMQIPPMRPRAVAPPVGDMAVGTMLLNNRSFVEVTGPPVTLTLHNASAKDALMSLARLGGYGFVYVGDKKSDDGGSISDSNSGGFGQPVTMSFRNERFDRALNSVLLASGMQGKLDGRTIMVGNAVAAKSFGPQMSKVFRLNQIKPSEAADYLGNLGAQISATVTETQTQRESQSTGGNTDLVNTTENRKEASRTLIETYGASTGPLLGLTGTTDSRLDTITLVGDPKLIAIAQAYLKQLDLRRRQVAVKVQILSINLENDKSIDASFSARMGNTFVVSQRGNAHLNFGRYKPGNLDGSGVYDSQAGNYGQPGTYRGQVPKVPAQTVVGPYVTDQRVVNPPQVPEEYPVPAEDGGTEWEITRDEKGQPIYTTSTNPAAPPSLVPIYDKNGRPVYVPSTDPAASQTLKTVYDKKGRPVLVSGQDPLKYQQPDNSFYAYVDALITSRSAKILAQPTLLVQEDQKASVQTTESYITGVSKTVLENGSEEFANERADAGLVLGLQVSKVDDNGFITMELKPSISVPVPAGEQEGVQIFNINSRELDSGEIRLRDGQSLILTGVITDQDIQTVRKWPILGDMPLLGQLFRSSDRNRFKTELVIIVTPSIINDQQGGTYGYGYRPGTSDARQLMQSGG
mgnify:CR=1 FL=1